MARRERQLVEIAALVVKGQHNRAEGLSFEHGAEFTDDAPVLASLLSPRPVLISPRPDDVLRSPAARLLGCRTWGVTSTANRC